MQNDLFLIIRRLMTSSFIPVVLQDPVNHIARIRTAQVSGNNSNISFKSSQMVHVNILMCEPIDLRYAMSCFPV